MRDDLISIELRLPEVKVLGVREEEHWIEVVAEYRSDTGQCPRCGRTTGKIHQSHLQRKRDAKLWGKEVHIALFKRRFRCHWCNKVFTEADPVCGRGRRTTERLRKTVARLAQLASVRAVSRVEGVSEGLVERSWMESHPPGPKQPLPTLIGMDGFCVSRPGRMWTGLWDLSSKRAVALTAGHSQVKVEGLLSSLPGVENVEAVVIDLWEPYRQAVYRAFPNAAVVADKFHVVALGQVALREVRGGRRGPGKVSALLDRGFERLNGRERERLIDALASDKRLASAWALKEGLRHLYDSKTCEEAEVNFDFWLRAARASGLYPFRRTAKSLERWREEILNYWFYPLTNAFVEGKHNWVKVTKRRAYGYRNASSFMLRILSQNHSD